jgi:hypothetical protein
MVEAHEYTVLMSWSEKMNILMSWLRNILREGDMKKLI